MTGMSWTVTLYNLFLPYLALVPCLLLVSRSDQVTPNEDTYLFDISYLYPAILSLFLVSLCIVNLTHICLDVFSINPPGRSFRRTFCKIFVELWCGITTGN